MKKSRITTALLAIGISASMVFQTPVFATEENAVAVSSGITTNGISGWPQGPEITSASAVIMEDTSDTILYAKDMDTTLSPAGAVKIMTCLLALENSQLDDQVTMTETGVSGVTDGGAHISSQLGEVFTMEQCLYALMLASANDIALQIAEQIAYYHKNASYIFNGLKEAGYTVAGGVNSPYVWLKTPKQMNSWEFFDYLLEKANVVGTPGSGFGPSGEGYFRLTAFGSYENTVKALERIKAL